MRRSRICHRSSCIDAPSHPGRSAHVSAASGVVQRGDFAYVIGDDELFLAAFRISEPTPGRLHRALGGDLPLDHDARKQAKPDLESVDDLADGRAPAATALRGMRAYDLGQLGGAKLTFSDASPRRLRRIESAYKVEGVHAALDTGVMTLTLVCDQDDAGVASPLLSATLPLEQEEKR
jgi:hypothetical protein